MARDNRERRAYRCVNDRDRECRCAPAGYAGRCKYRKSRKCEGFKIDRYQSKPAGTTSLVLGTSSGIHAWHNDYYIRRLRVGKNEAIYKYLIQNHPELVEDEYFRPHDTAVIEIPQSAPKGSILRTESAFDLLERVKRVATEWVAPGHRTGSNTHNVSATISLKKEDWDKAGEWMWKNRDCYNGLSVLPYDGGTYTQAPFEDITKKKFEELVKLLQDVNLENVIEETDETDLSGELACAGGSCEITGL
jgi:ribonucleoside-diphosphate reductase alpha chain